MTKDDQIVTKILSWKELGDAEVRERFQQRCGKLENMEQGIWNSYRTYLMENGWDEFERLPALLSSGQGYYTSSNPPSITCLHCGKTSYSLGDVEHKWCEICQRWHDLPTHA